MRPMWVAGGLALGCVVAILWPQAAVRRLRPHGAPTTRPSVDLVSLRASLVALAIRSPRRLIGLTAVGGGVLAGILGGPVAALVGTVYGALGARAVVRGVTRHRDTAARARRLDELTLLAADLRAGLPPLLAADLHTGLPSLAGAEPDRTDPAFASTGGLSPAAVGEPVALPAAVSKRAVRAEQRVTDLTTAVWRLAEQTGAPAADLVDRIEADARAADRAQASAAAQAAGAQATALLLAALPLGGIALGFAIGSDPLRVLLHTPLGAACATFALLLQCAGLAWADRLTNGPAR